MNRTILVLAVLLICATLINWYQDRAERDRELPAVAVSEPDLYIVGATISQYDGNGRLHHQIRADRLTHFTVTDATHLDTPSIMLFSNDGNPWQIGSGAGQIITDNGAGQEVVELWDGVTAKRQRDDGHFISIATDRMTFIPGSGIATTDDRVSIRTDQATIDAAGMSAQLDPLRLTFFSRGDQRVSTVVTRR